MRQNIPLIHWNFTIDSLAFSKQVTVPYTWNVEEKQEVQLYRGPAVYRTRVHLPSIENQTIQLYFGCIYHTAKVLVNGVLAGKHTGSGYTPFQLDVTQLAQAGDNEIVVTVDNTPSDRMLPHGRDFDWADDGGLIRPVCLTLFQPEDLLHMEVSYEMGEMGEERCSGLLHLDIEAAPQEGEVVLKNFQSGEEIFRRKVFLDGQISLPFQDLRLWEPAHPQLYTVAVRTKGDALEKRIGFRTVQVRQNKILLNGKEIFLKGCEWMPGSHPHYGMAEPFAHSTMRLMQLKKAGCVFTRFHWQQDDAIFDWCDENGLLVQEEIPFWGQPQEPAAAQLALAKSQADAMVLYHAHHPSIICWGVGNELNGASPATVSYVENMYVYFKNMDATRLVNYVSNSLGEEKNIFNDDAALHGDVAMWNEYAGLWQPCNDLEETILRTDRKCDGKPLVVSEFGLCEPHFQGGDARRAEILLQRMTLYKKCRNLAGYVWFSLNDYRTHMGEQGDGKYKQRIHGSTDLYGREKPSYQVFAAIK